MNHATIDEQPEPHSALLPEDTTVSAKEAIGADCVATSSEREKMTFRFPPGTGARMARLSQEWGFASNTQLLDVALAYLDQQTQRGLSRIEGLTY